MIAWWPLVLATAAVAEVPAYQACCAAVGAGTCPNAVIVVGPGTETTGSPQGWLATGLWELSCHEGAFFDPTHSRSVTFPQDPGVLITQMSRLGLSCFDAACSMPPGLCLRFEGKRNRVVRCDTTDVPAEASWRAPPGEPSTAVVLKGKVIKAARVRPEPRGGSRSAVATVRQAGRTARTAVGTTSVLPGGKVVGMGKLDFEVPQPPPIPCVAKPAMRLPSNQQVDEGNEAVVTGELSTALNKYRAAITINHCNAFAWAALGDALLQIGRPDEAIASLKVATQLMPNNFHAWTNLGRAAEKLGDRANARDAYARAVSVNPTYPPAAQGLRRVQ